MKDKPILIRHAT